jgi:hypothetical protein
MTAPSVTWLEPVETWKTMGQCQKHTVKLRDTRYLVQLA